MALSTGKEIFQTNPQISAEYFMHSARLTGIIVFREWVLFTICIQAFLFHETLFFKPGHFCLVTFKSTKANVLLSHISQNLLQAKTTDVLLNL